MRRRRHRQSGLSAADPEWRSEGRIARARRASDHPARGSVSEGIRLWFTSSPGLPTCRWFLGREATATKNANGVFTAPFKSQSRAHWVAGERRRAEILL